MRAVVVLMSALLAVVAVLAQRSRDSNNGLYKQFLHASDVIGRETFKDRSNDLYMPIRVMALDGAVEHNDDVAQHFKSTFHAGLQKVDWHLLSAAPEQIHLSFATDSDSVHLLWITGLQANATAYVTLNHTATGTTARLEAATWTYHPISIIPWFGLIHGTTLSGLVPGDMYSYSVGSAAGVSAPITFRAPDRTKDTIRVAFGGDMGTVQLVGWKVADQMQAYHQQQESALDAFWHLGDIAYSTLDPPRWNFEFFWDMYLRQEQSLVSQVPMTVTYGNHDFSGGDSGAFINRFRNPGTNSVGGNFYWAYTHGPVRYISMCTEVGLNPSVCTYHNGSAQFKWLEQELSSVNRSVTPWVILAGHRPMYSTDRAKDSGNLQLDIEPLLDKYKVDLELAGHMHETEITTPVLYNKAHMDGVVRNSNTSFTFVNPSAPVHSTVGTLGAVIRENWDSPLPDWSLVRHGSFFGDWYGFATLTVNRTALVMQFLRQSTGEKVWDVTILKQ